MHVQITYTSCRKNSSNGLKFCDSPEGNAYRKFWRVSRRFDTKFQAYKSIFGLRSGHVFITRIL